MAPTRRCSPGSWATTCASTSLADPRPTKRPRACRCTERFRRPGSPSPPHDGQIAMHAVLPAAQLRVDRRIVLTDRTVRVHESVENLSATDRPVGWTQHVTLGPPFLEKGATEFRASATRSRVFEGVFGPDDYLVPGADFDWPLAPRAAGGHDDLRVYTAAPRSSGYTAHLMDPARTRRFFVAFSPSARLAFGYVWRRADFPWMGIWEENHSRTAAPWNGRTLTRGLEFGVSPMPETRRQMIERGRLFDTPAFRWIPARQRVEVDYCAVLRPAERIPDVLSVTNVACDSPRAGRAIQNVTQAPG